LGMGMRALALRSVKIFDVLLVTLIFTALT
jgi:hypothetical protein